MTSTDKLNDIARGVADAWDAYLTVHDVSTPDRIEIAVKKAFDEWLDANTDELIERIASTVAKNMNNPDTDMRKQ